MRICLFEDHGFAKLEPLSLTRPVFDLLCGSGSLAGKQCRFFAPCEAGALVRPHLAPLYSLDNPRTPVNDTAWLRSGPTVLVNGRWLPPVGGTPELAGPCVALVGDEVAYVVLGPDKLTYASANTIDDCLNMWKSTLPSRPAGGTMIGHLWDLVQHNGSEICRDYEHQFATGGLPVPDGPLAIVGPRQRLLVDPTARLDPLVVADTSNGPVMIDREAVIAAFTRLEGPCYIGPQTHVLGAKIRAGTTLGPNCRIGGEVEASIVHGYSNKYHDGFLGHSYVGSWVNLGAGTHNSDLRNDYGEVTVTVDGQPVPTGQTKVGCFLGDHTKMGLGTLLNTGSNIGVCCNLLPSGTYIPKYVPSFASWWNGQLVDRADLEQLMDTATEVMRRRELGFSALHRDLLHYLYHDTAAERRRVVHEAAARRLRRSA
jgi:UDP-N-acetylglucosamine diphosphorylase/glucosamine-1-phosphate N-acetyltransferase